MGRHQRREGCYGGRQFALQPVRAKLMKGSKLQATLRQGSVQPDVSKRQNAICCRQGMAFKGADLVPEGFELDIHTHDTL